VRVILVAILAKDKQTYKSLRMTVPLANQGNNSAQSMPDFDSTAVRQSEGLQLENGTHLHRATRDSPICITDELAKIRNNRIGNGKVLTPKPQDMQAHNQVPNVQAGLEQVLCQRVDLCESSSFTVGQVMVPSVHDGKLVEGVCVHDADWGFHRLGMPNANVTQQTNLLLILAALICELHDCFTMFGEASQQTYTVLVLHWNSGRLLGNFGHDGLEVVDLAPGACFAVHLNQLEEVAGLLPHPL
jgi:hypothetical protein